VGSRELESQRPAKSYPELKSQRPAKSYTALQTVRHRFNIYAGSCFALALWRGEVSAKQTRYTLRHNTAITIKGFVEPDQGHLSPSPREMKLGATLR